MARHGTARVFVGRRARRGPTGHVGHITNFDPDDSTESTLAMSGPEADATVFRLSSNTPLDSAGQL